MHVVKHNHEKAKAHFEQGVAHLEHARWPEAEEEFRASLNWLPDRISTLGNLGAVLIRQEKYNQAAMFVTQTLKLDEGHAQSWLNQGLIEISKQHYEESVLCFDKALTLNPEYAEAWSNKGLALSELGQVEEALSSLNQALVIDPTCAQYWSNRGIYLAELSRLDQALKDHEQAIKLEPGDAEAHYNKGLLLLRMKRFSEGFAEYEWRWKMSNFSSKPLKTNLPQWKGPGHADHVLLWSEQGLGDEIFYASMITLLEKQDVKLTLCLDARLTSIFQRSFPNIRIVSHAQARALMGQGLWDAQAPLGSLGAILSLHEHDLKSRRFPYLQVDPMRLSTMREQVSRHGNKISCGLSWFSKNKHIGDGKSIPLNLWSDFLQKTDRLFFNLQYGDVKEEIQTLQNTSGIDVHQIPSLDTFNDIEGVLALIAACDCIITTSNVNAHLAGAMGKKSLVMVPHGKSKTWYWHDGDGYSPWYPSLYVLHQKNPTDWSDVMEQALDW
jgi:tetratricopeptide (TPR) repeat protein